MIRFLYKFFNFILLFSSVISGWTLIILVLNTSFSSEIKEVMNEMYINQKDFVLNVKDLSILLAKDANKRLNDIQLEDTLK